MSCTHHKLVRTWYDYSFFFFLLLFHPIYYLRPSILPRSLNSDPGSRSRLFSPLPNTIRVLHFYRERNLAFSPPVGSRRTAPTHPGRSQQLIFFPFVQRYSKSHDGRIRTPGPAPAAFEGSHETTVATVYEYLQIFSTQLPNYSRAYRYLVPCCF